MKSSIKLSLVLVSLVLFVNVACANVFNSIQYVAGENISAWQAICQKYSDGLYYKTSSNVCHGGTGKYVDAIAMDSTSQNRQGNAAITGVLFIRAAEDFDVNDALYVDLTTSYLTATVTSLPVGTVIDAADTGDKYQLQLLLSAAGSTTITVGAAITGGSDGCVFYDNGGVLGCDLDHYWDDSNNRLGILTSNPQATLSIGASNEFRVNSTGNLIRINNVVYSWPASQGAVNTLLRNSLGTGTLTWGSLALGDGLDGGTDNCVMYDNNNLVACDTNFVWDNVSQYLLVDGFIGLGTATPAYPIDNEYTLSSGAGSPIAEYSALYITGTAATVRNIAVEGAADKDGTGTGQDLWGGYFHAAWDGSQNPSGSVEGARLYAKNIQSTSPLNIGARAFGWVTGGTATVNRGLWAYTLVSGGTVTSNMAGYFISGGTAGTLTNDRTIYIDAPAVGATFSNGHAGIYIADQETAGTPDYSIQQVGATAVNSFEAALISVPRASAPASPTSGMIYVDSTAAPDELCFYDGAAWQGISSGTDANCA